MIRTAPEQAERPLAIEDDRTDAATNLFSSKVVLRADKILIITPANTVQRSTPEQNKTSKYKSRQILTIS